MAELVLQVPNELKQELEGLPEGWSEFALKAIRAWAFEMELKRSRALQRAVLETVAAESKLTREGAMELGRKINESMAEELREKGLV